MKFSEPVANNDDADDHVIIEKRVEPPASKPVKLQLERKVEMEELGPIHKSIYDDEWRDSMGPWRDVFHWEAKGRPDNIPGQNIFVDDIKLSPQGLPVDIQYRTIYPSDQLTPIHRSEDDVLKHILEETQLPGIRNHHPQIAGMVAQSLENFPELQALYYNS